MGWGYLMSLYSLRNAVGGEADALVSKASDEEMLQRTSDAEFEVFRRSFQTTLKKIDTWISTGDGVPPEARRDREEFALRVEGSLNKEEARRQAVQETTEKRDRRQAEWATSSERKRALRQRNAGFALMIAGGLSAGLSTLFVAGGRYEEVGALAMALGLTLVLVGYPPALFALGRARRAFEAKTLLAELDAETVRTAQALSVAPDDPTRLIEYWTSTQQRLDKFHADARGQLRSAYVLSQGSAVIGFLVVLVLGVVAAFAPSTTGTLVAGGIAAVAGALSGYVSHTFQVTYDRALRQTMAYFEQPVIASRLLHGERLLSQFPEGSEAKDQALLILVRAATSAPPEDSSTA